MTHSLHDLLDTAKGEPPPGRLGVDDLVTAGRRRRLVARTGTIGGGVLAVAASVALIGSLVTPFDGGGRGGVGPAAPPPGQENVAAKAAPGPKFTFTVDPYSIGDYQVLTPAVTTVGVQQSWIRGPGAGRQGETISTWVARLSLYQPGVFDPAILSNPTKVVVPGMEAVEAVRGSVSRKSVWVAGGDAVVQRNDRVPVDVGVLAWEYADHAWAVIEDDVYQTQHGKPLADETRLALAGGLRTTSPSIARLPFEPAYLPAGFTIQGMTGRSVTDDDGVTVRGWYAASNPRPDLVPDFGEDVRPTVPTVEIAIGWRDTPPPDAAVPNGDPASGACHKGTHYCFRNLPGGQFYVSVSDLAEQMTDEELRKVLGSLRFADFAEPGSWFAVA